MFSQVGEKLGKYEVEKRQAVENEDYDKAKLKKVQMDEYRLQVYKQLEVFDLMEVSGVCRHSDMRKTNPNQGSRNPSTLIQHNSRITMVEPSLTVALNLRLSFNSETISG